jgi:hypothetical protein
VVLFLFLTHLGLGIAFTLALVSREAGVKFFRFNFGLAAILVAIGLAFRPAGAAIVISWAIVGRVLTRQRPLLMWAAIVAGVAALVAQAAAVSQPTVPMEVLTVASFLSSAALLGGACTAMVLGHWYLVIPSLDVTHLQSVVKVHIASMVVRIVVVVAAVFAGIMLGQPGVSGVPSFRRYLTSLDSVFFWQRVLFGLAGPAVLSYLTWETAKIRSTQSATGILYVDFFTVVVGEVLAKYLLLATHVPL